MGYIIEYHSMPEIPIVSAIMILSKNIKNGSQLINYHLDDTIKAYRDDIFVLDILREEMRNDDPRIQRIIFD